MMPVESAEGHGPRERVRFSFEGCLYEAVSFLHDGGPHEVDGNAMFELTEGNDGAISSMIDITALEDFLKLHVELHPHNLQSYRLVTGEVDSKNPDKVFYYYFDGGEWHKIFNHRDSKWGKEYLVVRLVTDPDRGLFGDELC